MDSRRLAGTRAEPVLGMLGVKAIRSARWGAAILVVVAGAFSSANAASLAGTVQSGGTSASVPLARVKVTLYEATARHPSIVARATTDAAGRFAINVPRGRDTTKGAFFAQADLGGGVVLVAILGPTLPPSIVVNALTTVAAAYSMAQFYRTGEISGDPAALGIAALMNDNLVAVATGAFVWLFDACLR